MYNIIPRDNSMEEDAQTGEVGHGHPINTASTVSHWF